jgi:hypothetical protein
MLYVLEPSTLSSASWTVDNDPGPYPLETADVSDGVA